MTRSLSLVPGGVATVDVVSVVARPATDLDAERAVLGAILLDGGERSVFERVSQLLDETRFAGHGHAAIWRAMAALHARGVTHDVLTLAAELESMRALNAVGGAQALGELTDDVVTTVHVETHARLVFDASVRRYLGLFGARLAAAAASPDKNPGDLRDAAVEALQRLRVTSSATPPDGAMALLTTLWEDLEAARAGRTRAALPFGVPVLDRMSDGGMKRGGVYFLAARPGVGKTSLATQVAGAVASSGETVLYVALEPAKGDITQSLVACHARVSLTTLTRRPGALSQADLDALSVASETISRWPLHVADMTSRDKVDTVAGIEATMRSLAVPPSLVVVDHLLRLDSGRGGSAKEHEGVTDVVKALVRLGKRSGATILCLAHIGRAVAGKGELYRRPRIEDLAGGRTIEQEADGILILHREDKHPTSKESQGDPTLAGRVEVAAPKLRGVRDGGYGVLRFDGDYQSFVGDERAEPAGDWGSDS